MNFRHLSAVLLCKLMVTSALASGNHADGHDDQAIGRPGLASKVTRTIQMDMSDAMRFSVPEVTARKGETIRFVVTNSGKIKHEMVLGTEKALKAHYETMKKYPGMEHTDPNMVSVAPGKTGEIIWQFTRAGKVTFACLQPGHYDAGMKGNVTITNARE